MCPAPSGWGDNWFRDLDRFTGPALRYELSSDRLLFGGGRLDFRDHRNNQFRGLDREPVCPTPSDLQCGLRGDRLVFGGGNLELRGCGDNWFRGLDRGPMCPAPSDPRCELGTEGLVCGDGRVRFKG